MQPITTLAPATRPLSTVETQRLRRLLAAKGLRGADLDDAVQEVHLKVLRSGPDGVGLAPWVTRVAINVAMDHQPPAQCPSTGPEAGAHVESRSARP